MTVLSLSEVAEAATKAFSTFTDDKPDLVRIGLPPLDDVLGGLFPGSGGVLGLAQGVGKSSTILTAALASPDHHGIISLEDTEDVIGARIIAAKTGINSRNLRTKDLSETQKAQVQHTILDLREEKGVSVVCIPGGKMEAIEQAVQELGDAGARFIWLDYIQKVRHIHEKRNVEVAQAYTTFQAACRSVGAAFMVASQFSRQLDPTARPRSHWLKETGDLENEARLIVLGYRGAAEGPGRHLVHYVLDKSTFGGEGTTFTYIRDASGTLVPYTDTSEDF